MGLLGAIAHLQKCVLSRQNTLAALAALDAFGAVTQYIRSPHRCRTRALLVGLAAALSGGSRPVPHLHKTNLHELPPAMHAEERVIMRKLASNHARPACLLGHPRHHHVRR